MSAGILNIPCIADAYIDSENPDNNYGSTAQLAAALKYTTGQFYKHAIFRFDLSQIPPGVIIHSVNLSVYVTGKNMNLDATVVSLFASSDFVENEVTKNNYSLTGESGAPRETNVYLGNVLINQYQNFVLSTYNGVFAECRLYLYIPSPTGSYNDYLYMSSRETANPPILLVNYTSVVPLKPTIIGPSGTSEDAGAVIRFSWNYNSSVEDIQKKFKLQWSYDQVNWNDIDQTTTNTYYDIPADTFDAGNIYWRVKTYNYFDEESEFSDIASFYAIGKPSAPVIQTVSAASRPKVTWTASNQQIYQVIIEQNSVTIYDSGKLSSITTRSYDVKKFLSNGTYTVKVRIANEYELLSDYAEQEFVLALTTPDQPTISLSEVSHGIQISVTNIATADHVYIYRSIADQNVFTLIGVATAGVFIDYSAASGQEYDYFARAVVDPEEAFTDSAQASDTLSLKYNTFAPVSDFDDILVLKYNLNDIPQKNKTKNIIGTPINYAGRKRPVMELSEHIESGMTFTFYISSASDLLKLEALVENLKAVLFRDARGKRMYGILGSLNTVDVRTGQGYTVSFSLTEVDYDEELEV